MPFKGGSSHASDVTISVARGFVRCLHRRRACHGTAPARSVLAVASGIICKGGAKAAPSNHPNNAPFTPKTGPVGKHSAGKTITTLTSITGLPFRRTRSNVSCAFTISPTALNGRHSVRVGGLIDLLSNCFAPSNNRRLGIGIFSGSLLISTVRRPRGCPRLAVHISNCTIGFIGLAHRRRLSIVSHAVGDDLWLSVSWCIKTCAFFERFQSH